RLGPGHRPIVAAGAGFGSLPGISGIRDTASMRGARSAGRVNAYPASTSRSEAMKPQLRLGDREALRWLGFIIAGCRSAGPWEGAGAPAARSPRPPHEAPSRGSGGQGRRELATDIARTSGVLDDPSRVEHRPWGTATESCASSFAPTAARSRSG